MKVKPKKTVPEDKKQKKIEFIWNNPKKTVISKEIYAAYNAMFFEEMVANTSINATYEIFEDTAWFERYLLNTSQFSAAKDISESKALQKLVFESESFKDFKEKAQEIVDINNDQWLRVEMDACKRSSVMGEQWRKMEETKDIYPYWVYRGRMDSRERPEHVALEGKIFRIGDVYGDMVYPPSDWNCRCVSELVNDRTLREENKTVSKGSDYWDKNDPKTGKPYVDPDFRFNPGKQTMPNDSSYFQVFKSANKGNVNLFDL